MTLYDDETGLPGKDLALDRLDVALARTARTGCAVALLMIDPGDELVETAARLRTVIRAGDTLARLDGDRLAVVADDLLSGLDAEGIAERVVEEADETAAVGVVVADGPWTAGIDDMLASAETAMRQAREAGLGYRISDTGVIARETERARADSELRHAIASGELRLHYQPIVAIEDGTARGVEALVRWEHPEHGLLGPSDFVPIAESTGAIVPLGDWVLREACARMMTWVATHTEGEPLWLAVNMSAEQLRHPGVDMVVSRALAESGLDPELLRIEITLTDAVANPDIAPPLRRLRALGPQISIDMTEFASRGALADFPVDMIKVGPDQIGRILAEWGGVAEVIAHRVEDRDHEAALRGLGCELGQGYLYARPAPFDEVEALLAAVPAYVEPEDVEAADERADTTERAELPELGRPRERPGGAGEPGAAEADHRDSSAARES